MTLPSQMLRNRSVLAEYHRIEQLLQAGSLASIFDCSFDSPTLLSIFSSYLLDSKKRARRSRSRFPNDGVHIGVIKASHMHEREREREEREQNKNNNQQQQQQFARPKRQRLRRKKKREMERELCTKTVISGYRLVCDIMCQQKK